MEAFLAVREDLLPARQESELLIAQLEDGENLGPAKIFGKIKAGMSFIPSMLAFIGERNEVLLQREMGLGEYQYIYALTFFGYLDKDPADGPSFKITGDDDDHEAGPVRWNVHRENEDREDVREERDREIRRYLNKSLGAIANNQLQALDRLLADSDDPDLRAWRDQLAAEVEAMDSEPRRILWEEGLPSVLQDSFEPYRDRLESSYGTLLNAVEMGLVNHN